MFKGSQSFREIFGGVGRRIAPVERIHQENTAAVVQCPRDPDVAGFYLINVGYVTLALKSAENPVTLRQAIEMLSGKLGLAVLESR